MISEGFWFIQYRNFPFAQPKAIGSRVSNPINVPQAAHQRWHHTTAGSFAWRASNFTCLIGILTLAHYNPYIIGVGMYPPKTYNQDLGHSLVTKSVQFESPSIPGLLGPGNPPNSSPVSDLAKHGCLRKTHPDRGPRFWCSFQDGESWGTEPVHQCFASGFKPH